VWAGTIPGLLPDEEVSCLDDLAHALELNGYRVKKRAQRQSPKGLLEVPLLVQTRNGSEIWVGAHHPLVHPDAGYHPLQGAADILGTQVVYLADAHLARYALPTAYKKLQREIEAD